MGIDYKLIPDRTLTRLFSVENIERISSEHANCSSGVCWVPHHGGIAFHTKSRAAHSAAIQNE